MSHKAKLAIHIASLKAIPSGSTNGLMDGIAWIKDQERMKRDMKQAFAEAEQYIAAVKQAPNNPYGDDDEAIAKVIMDGIEERKKAVP